MHEVVRREQDLPADDVVGGEDRVQAFDQARLTYRGEGLQGADVGGPLGETERGHAGRDRTREHEHDAVARGVRGREIAAQLEDRRVVEVTALVGDRRRADLHYCQERHAHMPSSYVSSNVPMRTRSPSCTPARLSARSTPIRRNRCCT